MRCLYCRWCPTGWPRNAISCTIVRIAVHVNLNVTSFALSLCHSWATCFILLLQLRVTAIKNWNYGKDPMFCVHLLVVNSCELSTMPLFITRILSRMSSSWWYFLIFTINGTYNAQQKTHTLYLFMQIILEYMIQKLTWIDNVLCVEPFVTPLTLVLTPNDRVWKSTIVRWCYLMSTEPPTTGSSIPL